VTLAQTWLRQVFGAAGASLLAPLVALVAAGAVAAGGGFGGLAELGQIGSGPELPGTSTFEEGASIADADIVGADVAASGTAAGTTAGGGAVGGPGTGGAEGAPGQTGLPSPLLEVPPRRGGGVDTLSGPVIRLGPAPPESAPGGAGEEVPAEGIRGIEPVVPEPIRPVTNGLIDLLVGPPAP
jgi:hypothetical protein